MANALAPQNTKGAELAEQVIIGGDLGALTPQQRISYYHAVCESVGLNPYTKPFEYIKLNGKLTLYAKRDATDQLRSIHGISLSRPQIEYVDDMVMVTVEARDRHNRSDTDLGAVALKGLQGESRANAIMKAITKAKRRVTLSLAGLGWLDENEVDSIPSAQRVTVDSETGEIVDELTPLLARLNEVGEEFYGDDWPERLPKLVDAVTTGQTSDAQKMHPSEAQKLIAGIEKKMAQAANGEVVSGK